MKATLGLANGDVPRDPELFTHELADRWHKSGIGCLSVALPQPHAELSLRMLRDVCTLLADSSVRVSQFAGVNANLVHPDDDVQQASLAKVAAAVPAAEAIGARMILSGSGSRSPVWQQHFYGPDAANFTAAAEDRLVEGLTQVAQIIDGTELTYVVECHQLTTMRSPATVLRVLDRVDHPQVKANFDPVNMLDTAFAAYTNGERMAEMVDMVGDRYAPSCHVKDIGITTELACVALELPPGQGLIDLPALFAAAGRLGESVDLIVEHLSGVAATAAVEYVRDAAIMAGVELLEGC